MSGQLVKFTETPKGLLIAIVEGDARQEIEEIAANERLGDDIKFLDVIEWQLCNGWEAIPEEDYLALGALTSSILLSQEVERDDRTNAMTRVGKVYWYPEYQVMSEVTELLRHGFITYTLAEEIEKPEEPPLGYHQEGPNIHPEPLPEQYFTRD